MREYRRYSKVLIEEAVQLCRTTTIRKACKMTGVGYESLRRYWRIYKIKSGLPLRDPFIPPKYTYKQKADCIRLAVKYVDTGHIKSIQKAFIVAGEVLGIKGKSIYEQWVAGCVRRGKDQVAGTQQGYAPSMRGFPGDSSHTANPQSQRYREQNEALAAIRPAPKMIKRRRYTSEMIPPGVLKGHR